MAEHDDIDRLRREDLAAVLRDEVGNLADARRVVNDFFALAATGLAADGVLKLPGLGTFTVVRRKARLGRNPYSGKAALIPERRAVRYRPSDKLRMSVRGAADRDDG